MRSDRIRGRLRVVAAAFLSNGILLACPQHAGANGWEHASIPFGALVEALADDAERMRTQAAESLGYRGESRAVPPLLAALERPEPSPRVRAAVYSALGRLGDARTVPVLGDCLTREAREEVRATCVSALAGVGGDESLSFVLAAYGSDDSIIVRRRAVDALGAFPQPASVRLLSELLGNEDAALRRRAVAALGHTGSRAATAPLLAHLETASQNERPVVVEALGRLRDASATDALLAELERAREPRLRAHIAMALAMIRAPSAYDALVGMLSDPVPAVRFHAVQGLRNLGRSEAAGELVALYRAESTRVADRSPRSLVMDAPVVLAALALQTDILRALTELDAPRGLPAFLDAARTVSVDRDSQVALRVAEALYERRRLALYGLGYTRSPVATDLLAGPQGIGDADARLRAVAVRSLAVLDGHASLARLLLALGDPVADVRGTSAKVLGRLGDGRAVAPLLETLRDESGEVRRQAALALGYLGDPAARATLLSMADADPAEKVREAAAYAAKLLEQSG